MRRRNGRDVHGILLLDKPVEWTSNRALQRVRRLYNAAKAGHTGSLDPLATGMLPICLGSATKVCSYLLDARKSYRVTARLGAATDSGDAHGAIIARTPAMRLEPETVRSTLAGFRGESEQIPPMHSALKHKGRRLYELARQGVVVARPARPIHVFAVELLHFRWPDMEFDITCSKGVYVRTLVEDVAKALGTLGHVSALRRRVVEPFDEDRMVAMPTLEARAQQDPAVLDELLLPADSALVRWCRVVLPAALRGPWTDGRAVSAPAQWPRGLVRVYSPDDVFLGIGEVGAPGQLTPRRLFAAAGSAV